MYIYACIYIFIIYLHTFEMASRWKHAEKTGSFYNLSLLLGQYNEVDR